MRSLDACLFGLLLVSQPGLSDCPNSPPFVLEPLPDERDAQQPITVIRADKLFLLQKDRAVEVDPAQYRHVQEKISAHQPINELELLEIFSSTPPRHANEAIDQDPRGRKTLSQRERTRPHRRSLATFGRSISAKRMEVACQPGSINLRDLSYETPDITMIGSIDKPEWLCPACPHQHLATRWKRKPADQAVFDFLYSYSRLSVMRSGKTSETTGL